MTWIKTELEGAWIFEPKVFADHRGYFFESFNENSLGDTGIPAHFVQDNEAKSNRGVLRGLHYQVGENAQAKLVRVVVGEVLDVIVDMRPESLTYGKHIGVRLSGANKRQLFVPKGFAHGYVVLEDNTIFCYKCDAPYDKANEGGVKYDDPFLKIDWLLPAEELSLSEKDLVLPVFGEHKSF
ncbi:MAG: dTDP-4-dehydrorhamnose 3,5-epimerase [Saprospiraceae bacterium]|nr:dTDP-4-dehydrorhamnose 3,5-epimerase [Saprospiraceae bacterium]